MNLRVSIVSHQSEACIAACLRSLPTGLGVTVFDNASSDRTRAIVRSTFPDVQLIESPRNLGFGAAHNRVWRQHAEECFLLLNPDARLLPGCLERLLEALEEAALALVAPRLWYAPGRPQLSHGRFPTLFGDLRQARRQRALRRGRPRAQRALERELGSRLYPDWVSGACMLVRRSALEEVGGFDESFFLYLEDVDLCRRLRAAGASLALEAAAHCLHREGASHAGSASARAHFRRSRWLYECKWGTHWSASLYRWLRGAGTAPPPV